MCRTTLMIALSLVLLASPGLAANQPSGTISCELSGEFVFGSPPGLRGVASTTPPHAIRVKVKEDAGLCDNSGVIGGKFPITKASVQLVGRLGASATCGGFTSSLPFERTRLRIKWRGPNALGRTATVATSKANVVSATWDSGSERLIITTAPVTRGGFAGSTLSLRIRIDGGTTWDDTCAILDANLARLFFGHDDPSSATVP